MFDGECFNCIKEGHITKDYWSKKKNPAESNTATSKSKGKSKGD